MFSFTTMTNATRKAAAAILAVGLLLLGLGILVIVLKTVFIIIAAGLIFIAAIWCIAIALKMFILLSGRPRSPDDDFVYRENVQIHNGGDDDQL